MHKSATQLQFRTFLSISKTIRSQYIDTDSSDTSRLSDTPSTRQRHRHLIYCTFVVTIVVVVLILVLFVVVRLSMASFVFLILFISTKTKGELNV